MYLTIYLIGILVALYLIGKKIATKNKDIEFSGDIVCYLFAFFSWVTVFMFLMASLFTCKDDKTQQCNNA
jgi:hypothetical protein